MELYDFHDAVMVTIYDNDSSYYIKILDEKLDAKLKGYKFRRCNWGVSYMSVDENLTHLYEKTTREGVYGGRSGAVSQLRDGGFPIYFMLYDENKTPIGFTQITENDNNVQRFSNPLGGVVEVTKGVSTKTIENTEYKSIFLSFPDLPSEVKGAKYFSAKNSSREPISSELVTRSLKKQAAGDDVFEHKWTYNEETGLNQASYPCILYFLDGNKKVLGYSLVFE